jgi:hypothetical protein
MKNLAYATPKYTDGIIFALQQDVLQTTLIALISQL